MTPKSIGAQKRTRLIKARKRFEGAKKKALKKQSKNVDIGLLVSGVAHEFNNILGAADGHAEWALDSGETEDLKEALRVVRLACKRSFEITKALSVFNQPKEETYKKFNTQTLATDLKTLFQVPLKEEGIEYSIEFSKQNLWGNEKEIFEVLVNLLKNAMEAFPAQWPHPKITIQGKKDKSWYVFSVTDNAPTINKLYLDQLFKPFFSTKGVLSHVQGGPKTSGEKNNLNNRGLGLFLSKKIALEHEGSLSVENSASSKTFKLKIPCYNK